jgi:hypothetical protein
MPYEEGPEETEVYPKIGEMIQVRLLHHPTCPPTLCITSSTGGAGSDWQIAAAWVVLWWMPGVQVLWSNEWQVGVVVEVTPAKRVFKVAHLISHEAPEYVQELVWDREWRWVQQPKSAIVVQITVSVAALWL